MKSLSLVTKLFIVTALISFMLVKLIVCLQKPVLIQSLESKTGEGKEIVNQIKWFQYPDKDVWMMNQNHDGFLGKNNNWDRLAIIIDKTTSPKTARFLQLEPGPLVWSEDLFKKQIPFKISCFMCHTNGPRAIRADWNGLVKPSLFEKTKIGLFNLKMWSYGRVTEHSSHTIADENLKIPFRYHVPDENQVLQVKTCVECHNEQQRGFLKRQNAVTISFLIKNKQMPPAGYELTKSEIRKIQKFVSGF